MAAGVVGHEEGRRSGLRGGLGSGGANGGGGGCSRQRGRVGLGVRAQEGRSEGGKRLRARGKGLDDPGRGRKRGAVGRRCTASPWRFDVHPRRACRGRRHVAVREAPGRHQGRGEGWGAARGRRPRRPAANGDERREQRRDGVDGSLVINSKFQNAVCKISFSPSISPQMKNF